MNEILSGIQSKINVDAEKEEELVKIWLKNFLIAPCPWNPLMFEVGDVLKSEYYSLDKSDLTREKWLNEHRIILKPESKEYWAWANNSSLPF